MKGYRTRMLFCILFTAIMGTIASAKDLKVTTIERRPFAFEAEGGWTGFSIELWRMVAERIDANSTFIPVDQFTALLKSVEEGRADVAAANVSITLAREEVMDFSQPIFDAGLAVMTPVSNPTGSFFTHIRQQMLLLWLLGISTTLLIYEAVQWYIKRRRRISLRKQNQQTPTKSWSGLGTVLGGALAIGVGIFIAQLMASLIIKGSQQSVSSVEDLQGRNIGTTNGSTSAEFLDSFAIDYKGFDNIANLFVAMEDGTINAVVHDAPILKYYLLSSDTVRFEVSPRVFRPEKYGFAMTSEHPQIEAVNRALLQIREDGSYAELYAKWFGEGDF